jgi:hypothetical protein
VTTQILASPRPPPTLWAASMTSSSAVSAGTKAAVVPPYPARLARRGRPRPPRPLPATREVPREHHHLRDRLAPGRLHRHHPAPHVACSGCPARTPSHSVTAHGTRQIRMPGTAHAGPPHRLRSLTSCHLRHPAGRICGGSHE